MSTPSKRLAHAQQRQLEDGLLESLHSVFLEVPPNAVRETLFKVLHDWVSDHDGSLLIPKEDLYVLYNLHELAIAYQNYKDVMDGVDD